MGGAAGAGVRWAHRPMVRRPPIRVAAGRETQGSRGLGDARFERLGRCCGVKCAEPSDSGCVASSSLIATSRGPRHEAGAASLPKPTWLGAPARLMTMTMSMRSPRTCSASGQIGARSSRRGQLQWLCGLLDHLLPIQRPPSVSSHHSS